MNEPAATQGQTAQPEQPEAVQVSAEELQQLREAARALQAIRADEQQRQRQAEVANATREAQVGNTSAVQALVYQHEQREQQLRDELARTRLESEVFRATVGVAWAHPEAGRQAQQLLQSECELVQTESGVEVRHKASGKPLAAVIKERLASRSYTHFQAPTTQGGLGVVRQGYDPGGYTPSHSSETNNPLQTAMEQARAKVQGKGNNQNIGFF